MGAELVWGRIDLSPSKYYIHVECVSLRVARSGVGTQNVHRGSILMLKMKLFSTTYVTIRQKKRKITNLKKITKT